MRFFSAVVLIVCITGANSLINSSSRLSTKISGKRPHPVVMEGYVASIKEFPYAFRVYVSSGKVFIFCTGEAIHDRLIITAAHCVHKSDSVIVVTGHADQEDYVNGRHLEKYARYRIIQVFVHPQFDKLQYVNDVAILKTGRAMMHAGHKIIRVNYGRLTGPVEAIIFGWGGTEVKQKNNQLYGKHIKAGNCSLRMYPYYDNQYFCLLEKGICHGDSGGALIIDDSLYGVASFYQKNSAGMCGIDDLYYYTAMFQVKSFVMDCLLNKSSHEQQPLLYFMLSCFVLNLLLK